MASSQIPLRLKWIDFTRGIIMALMAWDHVTGFWVQFHYGGEGLQRMFPYLGAELPGYMSRFITHFCAPTFFFLSGVSLALSTTKKLAGEASQREVTLHLVKRAGVLLLLAAAIEGNSFGSGPLYFGVLGCFAGCFIVFSLARRLPWQVILVGSLLIVLFHPYLDLSFIPNSVLRSIIHEPNTTTGIIPVLYPILPWLGVMGLGWCFGVYLYKQDASSIPGLYVPLIGSGVILWAAFIAIRFYNGFGNLVYRSSNTIQAWLAVSKYPPDLAFLTVTLGGMCFLLALGIYLEKRGALDKGLIDVLQTYGRTPLFFYVVHLPLYRVRPFYMTQRLFNMDYTSTALFWVIGLAILWRLCRRYEKAKKNHPDSLLQYI
jgi:uncharacterized membrane protein